MRLPVPGVSGGGGGGRPSDGLTVSEDADAPLAALEVVVARLTLIPDP